MLLNHLFSMLKTIKKICLLKRLLLSPKNAEHEQVGGEVSPVF